MLDWAAVAPPGHRSRRSDARACGGRGICRLGAL